MSGAQRRIGAPVAYGCRVTTTPARATIGDYELLAPLGEGGMGIVHLARRGEQGARVALKVLRPHVVSDREASERLAQEVRALSKVRSSRIAGILDADPFGGTPYVVTRYVPGLSLDRHVVEEGVVEGSDLLHFATCLAEALEAVHAVGVLHRDVKPSNVLMEGRSPVLIDFGLARAAEDPKLTVTGYMLGTPGYLPPEVLYGEQATAAGDVYAWAATTAFAATGRAPFGRGHTMAILDRVRRGDHDLTGIPDPLAGLLHRCLAVEAVDRPPLPQVLRLLREWQQPTLRKRRDSSLTMPVSLPTRPSGDAETTVVVPPDAQHTAVLSQAVPAPQAPLARGEGFLRAMQLLGIALAVAAGIAAAPVLGLVAVGGAALLLRTFSVTRQRHAHRVFVRGGRTRWFDVPVTTLSTPGYVLLAAGGATALVVFAGLVGLGATAIATLAGQAREAAVLVGGAVVAPALWWGPGSARVREVVRPVLPRTQGLAVLVTALGLVVAAGLVAVLAMEGPDWSPFGGAPWE